MVPPAGGVVLWSCAGGQDAAAARRQRGPRRALQWQHGAARGKDLQSHSKSYSKSHLI